MKFQYYINGSPGFPTEVPQEGIHEDDWQRGYYVGYKGEGISKEILPFRSYEDYEAWVTAEERKHWVMDGTIRVDKITAPAKDAINPSHYKQLLIIKDGDGNVTDTIQWLEHLQYKPFWRQNMRAFVQAVMDMCCDKYLSRMGMKDDELQEMEKSLWYHKFATAIMTNNYEPVRVADVETILAKKYAADKAAKA